MGDEFESLCTSQLVESGLGNRIIHKASSLNIKNSFIKNKTKLQTYPEFERSDRTDIHDFWIFGRNQVGLRDVRDTQDSEKSIIES